MAKYGLLRFRGKFLCVGNRGSLHSSTVYGFSITIFTIWLTSSRTEQYQVRPGISDAGGERHSLRTGRAEFWLSQVLQRAPKSDTGILAAWVLRLVLTDLPLPLVWQRRIMLGMTDIRGHRSVSIIRSQTSLGDTSYGSRPMAFFLTVFAGPGPASSETDSNWLNPQDWLTKGHSGFISHVMN